MSAPICPGVFITTQASGSVGHRDDTTHGMHRRDLVGPINDATV